MSVEKTAENERDYTWRNQLWQMPVFVKVVFDHFFVPVGIFPRGTFEPLPLRKASCDRVALPNLN